MNTSRSNQNNGEVLLRNAARVWFCTAALGLSLFVVYVLFEYSLPVLNYLGVFESQTNSSANFISGDNTGNLMLFLHVTLAIYVTGGGLLQMLPWMRKQHPKFHRWNGRIYVACAVICSLAGQYLIQTRDIPGNFTMDLGTIIAGVLVLIFSYKAVSAARAKQFMAHRQWALRLFIAANAVWFFRIGLMLWLAINQGPVGIDMETFTGPALNAIAYGQFLLPLFVLELYFFAERSYIKPIKVAIGSFIVFCAVATLAGSAAASFMMWFPRLLA